MSSKHAYLAALILLGTMGTAYAQRSYVDQPYITRVCLWNADKHTWRALDLERAQVHRLIELRKQFPAVVDGQWMDPGDEAKPPTSGWRGGPVVTSSYHGDPVPPPLPAGRASIPPFSALQTELRKVLSMEQLMEWQRMCNRR